MTTFTRGIKPIQVSRGRAGAMPMRWQSPSGAAINIAGFVITAGLRWFAGTRPVTVTVTDSPNGAFTCGWSADLVSDLPEGRIIDLAVNVVAAGGEAHDFVVPVIGVIPLIVAGSAP